VDDGIAGVHLLPHDPGCIRAAEVDGHALWRPATAAAQAHDLMPGRRQRGGDCPSHVAAGTGDQNSHERAMSKNSA
jgi:hypothetical protein